MEISTSLVLLLLIPITFVSVMAVLLVRWFTNSFDLQMRAFTNHEQRKQMLSLRTQAYERLTIFMERIQPQSLILREQQQSMSSQQFHSHLLKAVRAEYEHNLAMQIYMSGTAWLSVVQLRDEIVKLINTCAAETNPQHPSMVLGQTIIERSGSIAVIHNKALDAIKNDVAKL